MERRSPAFGLRPMIAANMKTPVPAAIRDPEPLAKFPEDARKAFQALWADVDALLKKAGGL